MELRCRRLLLRRVRPRRVGRCLGNGDEGDAFGERFEYRVQAGVGDDGGGAFEKLELRGVADDDWIAGQGAEAGGVEAAAEGEDELDIVAGACFGDGAEDGL